MQQNTRRQATAELTLDHPPSVAKRTQPLEMQDRPILPKGDNFQQKTGLPVSKIRIFRIEASSVVRRSSSGFFQYRHWTHLNSSLGACRPDGRHLNVPSAPALHVTFPKKLWGTMGSISVSAFWNPIRAAKSRSGGRRDSVLNPLNILRLDTFSVDQCPAVTVVNRILTG